MEQAPENIPRDSPKAVDAHLAEFSALRNEIAQRSQFQHQYVMFLVAAYGAICSFALSAPERNIVAAVAPVLTLALYLLWVHQGLVINSIAKYINDCLSDPCCEWLNAKVVWWDKYPKDKFLPKRQRAVRRQSFLVAHAIIAVVMPLGACLIALRGLTEIGLWRYVFVTSGFVLTALSFIAFMCWYYWFYRDKRREGDEQRAGSADD